jgi:hypothetical protein
MTEKPDLKVVELFPSNFRDPAATLRYIADQIAAGEYGEVRAVGMVLLGTDEGGNKLELFAMGPEANIATQSAMFLEAANNTAAAALGLGLEQ